MSGVDQAKTTFTMDQEFCCYRVMPFGLKNVGVGATYQRLVNKMFAPLIEKSMEVYIDDMLVKTKRASDNIRDLKDNFDVLRQYQMKLNPTKCAFEFESRKFLEFLVNLRCIEVNPAKAQAIINLQPPCIVKEIQKLIRTITITLSPDLCLGLPTNVTPSSKHSRARAKSTGMINADRPFRVSKCT